ncbi:tetratricopeptide repeat protein [Planktomarina temperata]|nr:tetratricopeptide repeat protein [Planktomarina temperata]
MTELTIDQALQQGIEAHKAGQVQEADRLYTAILKAQPKHPDANHNMGALAVGVGKVEQALPFFKTALEANANTAQFWLSYIDALIKLDKLSEAKAVLDQAKSKGAKGDGFDQLEQSLQEARREPAEGSTKASEFQPKQPNILDTLKLDQALKLAKKKSKEGPSEEAKRVYLDILEKFPQNKRAIDGLKRLSGATGGRVSKLQDPPKDKTQALINLYNQGQLQPALELAKAIIKQYPDTLMAWNVLAAVHKGLGQIIEASKAFKKVTELNPQYCDGYNNLGVTLTAQGKLEEAINAYNKALAIKPDYADAYYNMGNALKEQGKLQEAIEAYNKALTIKPDYDDAYINMGISFKDQGKLDAAIEAYKKAIAIAPKHPGAYNNMGIIFKEKGQLEEAIESYNKALVIDPDHAEAYYNKGNALKDQGKLEEAVKIYIKALVTKPDNAAAYNNLGFTLQEQGRLEEATASYKKALAIKPDYAEANNNMGNVLKEQGKLKKAIEFFERDSSINSQTQLLACFYELDNKDYFYNQLDNLIEQGQNNAVIGSYVSRSQIKYGIRRSNPFCNDPLKYTLHTNLTGHCNFEEIFIKGATDILTKDIVQRKSQNLLTDGIQTTGNVFNQLESYKDEIQNVLRSQIENYRMSFEDSQEGLIKSWPSNYEISGWLVSMKNGGKLAPHMHDNGWVSGSVYINVPPKINKDSGNFVVCLDSKDKFLSIDVVTGSLCLFPSSLLHYTIPFKSDENRIVLAFDVIPK